LIAALSVLGALSALVLSGGGDTDRKPVTIGSERLVSHEALQEMDGQMCEWMPVSAAEPLMASLQSAATAAQEPFPSEVARDAVYRRAPLRTIKDTSFGYSAVAVDAARNEVVLTDENNYSIVVYDRMENTPPTASMSEPKRMIRGAEELEYLCGTYVDPVSGDIYAINNDTVNWLVVYDRNAKGDAPPTRRLHTPHTTFGIAVDEEKQEMFLTIQDDHAVVVYDKTAKEEDPIKRTIQGSLTQMADPHGIAVDSKTDLIYVSNWGSANERPDPGPGVTGGGGLGGANRPDFPIGRSRAFLGSGKFLPPSITVYRKDASGNVAPLQVIRGPKTQLDWPTALAVHPDRGELFVANDTADSVLVFRADATGDVAPIRVLKGPRTMIKNPIGVTVDLKNNELWVANFGSHAATVFKIDAEGNAPPLRAIRSALPDVPAPMFSNPYVVVFDSKRKELLVAN
jgi:DNA-binding beta-propeller fold protein YncE